MLNSIMPPATAPKRRPTSGTVVVERGLRAWTLAVLAFLYLPIAVLVVYSFNASRLNVSWQGFTLDWYRQLAVNAPLKQAAWNSLVVALATTVLSIVIGTGGAWLLHRHRFPASRLIQTLVALPMVMPEILLGISLLVLFATAGVPLGFTTVIIGHVTFSFPFVLVAVQARLRGMDPALEEAGGEDHGSGCLHGESGSRAVSRRSRA